MGNLQNTRILRFLIVLTAVVLTIFIYASYSNSQTLLPPPMRTAALISPSSSYTYSSSSYSSYMYNNKSNNLDSKVNSTAVISSKKNVVRPVAVQQQQQRTETLRKQLIYNNNNNNNKKPQQQQQQQYHHYHHREPTIDENANEVSVPGIDDMPADANALEYFANNNSNNDLLQEDQYVQTVDNALGNINLSTAKGSNVTSGKHKEKELLTKQQQQQQITDNNNYNNNLNKIPDSDVLIPTTNLQKFIESADKILKNITVQHIPGQRLAPEFGSQYNKQSPAKYQLESHKDAHTAARADNMDNNNALPPSSILKIKNTNQVRSKPNEILTSAKASLAGGIITDNKNVTPKLIPPAVSTDNKTNVNVTKTPAPHTQEIPTGQLYEAGHRNNEIDVTRLCPNKGTGLKLLILITSAQTHFEARMAIRQTWGHYATRRDVSTAFILGRTTNTTLRVALMQENFIFGDLIRGHFIDSYNNLTLKTISALEWVDQNCPKAKYILKTDDDMFINVPKLLQFLDTRSKDKRVIYGRLAKKWKPIRNKKSKYYVSTGQFSAAIFPAFTTGPAYVMSSDIIHDLYAKALQQVYLKLEDVFTTGIVAQKLAIPRIHVNEFLNRRIVFNPCNIRKAISIHMVKANEQFDLWKKLLDQTTKCK